MLRGSLPDIQSLLDLVFQGREEMAALRTGPAVAGAARQPPVTMTAAPVTMTAAPVTMTAAPVTMTSAPVTYATPGATASGQSVTYTGAPVTYAAGAPVTAGRGACGATGATPGPMMATGAPVTYGTPGVGQARVTAAQGSAQLRGGDLFDALDTNGDGVLSREEMAAMQANRPAPGVSFGGAVTYAGWEGYRFQPSALSQDLHWPEVAWLLAGEVATPRGTKGCRIGFKLICLDFPACRTTWQRKQDRKKASRSQICWDLRRDVLRSLRTFKLNSVRSELNRTSKIDSLENEVCFFTSYRYLEQVLEKWYETGPQPF